MIKLWRSSESYFQTKVAILWRIIIKEIVLLFSFKPRNHEASWRQGSIYQLIRLGIGLTHQKKLSANNRVWHKNLMRYDADVLTHWGRVTHICVGNLTNIGSDNGLSPSRRQAIIWNNDGILFIGPLGTNFSEILFAIYKFSFKKMRSSGKWRPFCLGLNVLRHLPVVPQLYTSE